MARLYYKEPGKVIEFRKRKPAIARRYKLMAAILLVLTIIQLFGCFWLFLVGVANAT